jgi:hypothetical protein
LFSQQFAREVHAMPCGKGFVERLDTLVLHIDDVGIRPVKRRIQMIRTQGNWFRVQYDDSKGAIALRQIHKQRINKFFKLYLGLKDEKISAQDVQVMNLTINSSVCNEIAPIFNQHLRKLEKMKRVLKIWK